MVDLHAPNAETTIAIRELEDGKGARFKDIDSLMADLRELELVELGYENSFKKKQLK